MRADGERQPDGDEPYRSSELSFSAREWEWGGFEGEEELTALGVLVQVREIASVTKAVANGDLTKTVDIGASGEIRELKMTVNSMVCRLGSYARGV